MKRIYFVGGWVWSDLELKSCRIVKETSCYYFLDKDGPKYARRLDKDNFGKTYFKTKIDALDNLVQKYETKLKNAQKEYTAAVRFSNKMRRKR